MLKINGNIPYCDISILKSVGNMAIFGIFKWKCWNKIKI